MLTLAGLRNADRRDDARAVFELRLAGNVIAIVKALSTADAALQRTGSNLLQRAASVIDTNLLSYESELVPLTSDEVDEISSSVNAILKQYRKP